MRHTFAAIALLATIAFLPALGQGPGDLGRVEFTVTENGKLVPCRLHVKDAAGKAQRGGKLPFWHDHIVCAGSAHMDLPAGKYTYECERGPECPVRSGAFTVAKNGREKIAITLERLVDLSADGWWCGDLHVHRPVEDVELLMRAEDLHVAPVITWWNKRNLWAGKQLPAEPLVRFDGRRAYHLMAGEDEREGGALLFFNLARPLDIAGAGREHPSPMVYLLMAQQLGAWIDIEKPFWWDVPIWLASGKVDSIGIANNHMCRSQMYESEAWGKPRFKERLPAPLGNGYWSQEIYYHVLNTGLRMPPSAGSASGVLPNPVGYNRVYVHLGPEFSYEKWWQGLKAGRSFVTNGPLLLVRAGGELPGHVFTAAAGKEVRIDLQAALTTREPIRRLEIIRDGAVERSVSFDDWSKTGSLGELTFAKSGWFLVRAVADNKKTFRFASTAPFYVEIGEAPRRVSKGSAQFFLDWVQERARRVQLADAGQRQEVLKYHAEAEKFWRERVRLANAE
jgi:hypothetical protein